MVTDATARVVTGPNLPDLPASIRPAQAYWTRRADTQQHPQRKSSSLIDVPAIGADGFYRIFYRTVRNENVQSGTRRDGLVAFALLGGSAWHSATRSVMGVNPLRIRRLGVRVPPSALTESTSKTGMVTAVGVARGMGVWVCRLP